MSVFVPDMIGARVAYFESKVGPAWRVTGDTREYKIKGCEVTVTVDGQDITSLGIEHLSPRCSFDITSFLRDLKGMPPAYQLTMGSFEKIAGQGLFTSTCYVSCGNSQDPIFYDHWQGSHAQGFVNITLGMEPDFGSGSDAGAEKASSAWGEIVKREKGNEWMISHVNICNKEFDAPAHRLFADVRVTSISIGSADPEPTCSTADLR